MWAALLKSCLKDTEKYKGGLMSSKNGTAEILQKILATPRKSHCQEPQQRAEQSTPKTNRLKNNEYNEYQLSASFRVSKPSPAEAITKADASHVISDCHAMCVTTNSFCFFLLPSLLWSDNRMLRREFLSFLSQRHENYVQSYIWYIYFFHCL